MADEIEVAKAARRLSALTRTDPSVRAAIVGVVAAEGCDDLAELAAKKPDVILDLDDAFAEMALDEAAMEKWDSEWRPANLAAPIPTAPQ